MGFEFGEATQITRKWIQPMRVFVGGKPTEVHLTELDRVIEEINELSTDGFEISLVEDSLASNFYVFFGSHKAYQWMYPLLTDLIENNVGLFSLDWDNNHNLHSGHMYVDTERVDVTAQLHIIREELTQSIGLGRDSYKYSLSIFQQRWSTVMEYTALDRDLIRVLYHPKMTTGYNETNVSRVLKEIFEKLEIEMRNGSVI